MRSFRITHTRTYRLHSAMFSRDRPQGFCTRSAPLHLVTSVMFALVQLDTLHAVCTLSTSATSPANPTPSGGPDGASTSTSYRLFIATCGVGELEPILLTVVRGVESSGEKPKATLTQSGPVVATVGSASKWVEQHPTKNVLVSIPKR